MEDVESFIDYKLRVIIRLGLLGICKKIHEL